MIAKEMSSGKSAGGLINYVFDGKVEHHRGKEKQAHIMAASADLLLPYNFQDKEAIKQLEKDFNNRTSEYLLNNPENKSKLVGHVLLSFTDNDLEKLGGDAKKVLDEFIKLSGLDKTQYFAVGHLDTKNYHVHIVYNKVNDNGQLMNEWKSKNKAVERGVALSLKHKLELVGNSAKLAGVKGVLEIRKKDDDIIKLRNSNPLLKEARNMLHLEKLAEKHNVKLDYSVAKNQVILKGKGIDKEDLNAVFYLNRNPDQKEKNSKERKSIDDRLSEFNSKSEYNSNTQKDYKPENSSKDIFQGMFTGGSDDSNSKAIKVNPQEKNYIKTKKKKRFKPDYAKKSEKQIKSNSKSIER